MIPTPHSGTPNYATYNPNPTARWALLRKRWFDVSYLQAELEANPQLWNQFTLRTRAYQHRQVDDIWVRYNAWENFDEEAPAAFNEPHDSVWYPAASFLPSLKPMIYDLMRFVEGERLGGVLITRIPPGGEVRPHVDAGWHAGYYDKFAIQVKGHPKQAFCFEGEAHITVPGDIYSFDNSHTHWVTNDSLEERITLIVCIRLAKPRRFLCSDQS